MKRTVQLFLEGQRVDLFNDEQIEINSQIQDIADISKTFTDFTQSFQVPASTKNNELLRHFYNSDVSLVDGVFTNPSLRRAATIEIDNTFFRRGKLALEKANIKKSQPYSYTLTFYGDLVTLKDKFGEDKLKDLDWTALSFPYTLQEFRDRIEDGATDYAVRFPMISGKRYWQYANPGTPNENIDTSQGAINIQELFPAVRWPSIIDVIESHYGITFQGTFLQDEKFTKAFLYFKNTVEFILNTPPVPIVFSSVEYNLTTVAPPFPYFHYYNNQTTNGQFAAFDNTDNSIRMRYVQYLYQPNPPAPGSTSDVGTHKIEAVFTNLSQAGTIYVDVYTSPGYLDEYTFQGTIEVANVFTSPVGIATVFSLVNTGGNQTNLDIKARFETRTDIPITFDVQLIYSFETLPFPELGGAVTVDCVQPATSLDLDLATLAPDITVQDLISNLLKLFNLTVYGINETTYELQTLEEYYNEGRIYDITQYTETDTIQVDRIKLFKRINFAYKQSKSLTNRFFANTFLREYGDLGQAFAYDGGEYTIEVIFENILFSPFSIGSMVVGYCLDENLNGYVPQPVVLYEFDVRPSGGFYLTDGTTTVQLNDYMKFGQDADVLNTYYSLNWGTEKSPILQTIDPPGVNENGLYNTYYASYLQNLYDPKNRQYTVKAQLPLSITTAYKLNDRFVIRDQRYILQSLKINLTTGNSTMVLIRDFRQMIADQVPPIFPPIRPEPIANCIQVAIPFINGAVSATIAQCQTSVAGVTITPSTITQAQRVEICLPEYEAVTNYLITEQFPLKRISSEDVSNIILESSSDESEVIIICVTYTYANGDQVVNEFYIQRT